MALATACPFAKYHGLPKIKAGKFYGFLPIKNFGMPRQDYLSVPGKSLCSVFHTPFSNALANPNFNIFT
jgi:hypothetical protein